MDVCGHSYYQALQCATLTHGAKQCSIFVDTYDECEVVWEDLYKEGLNVVITKHKKHV